MCIRDRYDIDDLHVVVSANMKEREKESENAMNLISQEVNKFNNWLGTLDAVPTIVEIRKRVENIGNQEMERTLKKIPHLSEEDKKIIYQMKNSMINKILHKPTIKLKQKTQSEDGHIYLKAIRHLFHLDD